MAIFFVLLSFKGDFLELLKALSKFKEHLILFTYPGHDLDSDFIIDNMRRFKKLNKLGFYGQWNLFKLETSQSKKKKLKNGLRKLKRLKMLKMLKRLLKIKMIL